MLECLSTDAETALCRAVADGDLENLRASVATLARRQPGSMQGHEALVEGIRVITRLDDRERASQLLQGEAGCSELRWGLRLWQAAAELEGGRLEPAGTAIDVALEQAIPLDPSSRATTLTLRATIAALRGDAESGCTRMVEAARLGDERGGARLWLFWAQVMRAVGRELEGLRALSLAAELVHEPWAAAPLARHALLARRVDAATEILRSFLPLGGWTISDEPTCLLGIVEDIGAQRIAVDVVAEYLWLSDRMRSDRAAALVQSLLDDEARGYPPLRGLFAWDLAGAGLFERAAQQLRVLVEDPRPALATTARRARARLAELEAHRRLGVLDVARIAVRALAPDHAEDAAGADLFWVRRAMAAGQLDRAADELARLESDERVERLSDLLGAFQAGEIPPEVAREYLGLLERPASRNKASLLQAFGEEHR